MTHNINLVCEIQKYDRDGNLILTQLLDSKPKQDNLITVKVGDLDITFPMRSFNRNIAGFMHYNMLAAIYMPSNYIWNVTGGTVSGASTMFPIGTAGVGVDSGIIVGTGSFTASMYNYNVQYKCVNGTGIGQLSYQGSAWTAPYASGSSYALDLTRSAINNSPQPITVTEIMLKYETGTTFSYLITYDTINVSGSTISVLVPTGSVLTVKNTFTIDSMGPLNLNFLQCLYSGWANTARTLTSFSGSSLSVNYSTPAYWNTIGGTGNDIQGIIVGSGSTEPFNLTGSTLQGHIRQGTGSNQIYYYANDYTAFPPVIEGSSSISHAIQRYFINQSDTPVTVGECCFNIEGASTTDTKYRMMIARNVFNTPVILQNWESMAITYKFIYRC
jgi:hypothetical protein